MCRTQRLATGDPNFNLGPRLQQLVQRRQRIEMERPGQRRDAIFMAGPQFTHRGASCRVDETVLLHASTRTGAPLQCLPVPFRSATGSGPQQPPHRRIRGAARKHLRQRAGR